MKRVVLAVGLGLFILVALGTSNTAVGHFIQAFPGLSGSGIGLLLAGLQSVFPHG